MRRLLSALALTVTTVLAALAAATPAHAATLDQKLAVLSAFTQATAPSQAAWAWGRANPGAYPGYGLDWSTDYCSDSPDEPLGFDFRLPCWRHDFGYRNFKAVGRFPANKDRVDSAFYVDLKAKCATYSAFVRPACYSLAWTYYQAVHNFGSVVVGADELAQAAAYKASLVRQSRGSD